MDGGEGTVAGALGQHCKPDRDCGGEGLAPADDFPTAFGRGGEMRDWQKSGGSPKLVAVEADGVAGLDGEESVGDGLGLD